MTVLLALSSSLLWGVADFLGGKVSRGRSTIAVVLLSQAAGLVVAFAVAVAAGSFADPAGYVPWAVGAGLAGGSAVLLFYRALAIGTMGVVAPVAALGVIIPVVLGVFGGVMPSALCVVGIVWAIGGVVATARPAESTNRTAQHARSVVLAVAAAGGFGFLQYAISGGAAYSTVMTMLVMRCTSVPLLALVLVLACRGRQGAVGGFPPRVVLLIAAIGVFDVGANLLFAVATVSGALPVVAVLGSLYPAATVLLARVVDHETMSRSQNVGVVVALSGVAMIAAGS